MKNIIITLRQGDKLTVNGKIYKDWADYYTKVPQVIGRGVNL